MPDPDRQITIRCTRSRGPRGFFCLQDFRRGPVNVDVITLDPLILHRSRKIISIRQLTLTILFLALNPIQSFADRPPESPESLHRMSSDVIEGTVVQVYINQEQGMHWRRTDCAAEVLIDAIEKGTELNIGDKIFVKYYYKEWVGSGPTPPSWNGQRGAGKNSPVRLYIRGNKSTGFKVVEPNGFAIPKRFTVTEETSKPKPKQTSTNKFGIKEMFGD